MSEEIKDTSPVSKGDDGTIKVDFSAMTQEAPAEAPVEEAPVKVEAPTEVVPTEEAPVEEIEGESNGD